MRNEDPLSNYNIKPGNTIYMIKGSPIHYTRNRPRESNSAGLSEQAGPGVPTNLSAPDSEGSWVSGVEISEPDGVASFTFQFI
jgi:hypothetical protein